MPREVVVMNVGVGSFIWASFEVLRVPLYPFPVLRRRMDPSRGPKSLVLDVVKLSDRLKEKDEVEDGEGVAMKKGRCSLPEVLRGEEKEAAEIGDACAPLGSVQNADRSKDPFRKILTLLSPRTEVDSIGRTTGPFGGSPGFKYRYVLPARVGATERRRCPLLEDFPLTHRVLPSCSKQHSENGCGTE
jgi:hypothetical protein